MHEEADFKLEPQEIAAESIGWIPLEEGVYLHVSDEKRHRGAGGRFAAGGGGGVVGYLISPVREAWSLAVGAFLMGGVKYTVN